MVNLMTAVHVAIITFGILGEALPPRESHSPGSCDTSPRYPLQINSHAPRTKRSSFPVIGVRRYGCRRCITENCTTIPDWDDDVKQDHCEDWKKDDPPFAGFTYVWYGRRIERAGVCRILVWAERHCEGEFLGYIDEANSPDVSGRCVAVGDPGQAARSMKVVCDKTRRLDGNFSKYVTEVHLNTTKDPDYGHAALQIGVS